MAQKKQKRKKKMTTTMMMTTTSLKTSCSSLKAWSAVYAHLRARLPTLLKFLFSDCRKIQSSLMGFEPSSLHSDLALLVPSSVPVRQSPCRHFSA